MDDDNLMATLAEATPLPGTESLPNELLGDAEPVLQKIKRVDEQREGFPGEHWLVLGLGIAVWHYTRSNSHWAVRTAGSFAAAALVARAASGREGLSKVLRYTPFGSRIARGCPPCDEPQAQGKR
ncbi:MAG: hypothetical protein JWP65_3596 [Ramlibacter sp.]|uniref:hypothetical protein n=1 Tax=Ramlibacter sp. TaxID=1917967 RepID=UPI0026219A36|nr:hypothetical protein [Ramlibacter sp.]MDB5753175.1 hypothetical protein [Ramlibacter sp.]